MWGAISQMGEDLQGLVAKENDSDSEHEEEEAAPEDSPVEMPAPRKVTSPIPLLGMPPLSVHVDAASVRDSVRSAVPKQLAAPLLDADARKPDGGLFTGKADAVAKGKLILVPMIGSTPPHVDFTASWSGDDVSLVD